MKSLASGYPDVAVLVDEVNFWKNKYTGILL